MDGRNLPPATHIRMPVEMYQHIFRHVDSNTLFSLCTVSQIFQDESERILYSEIDFSHASYRQIRTWSNTVGICPRVSRRVRSLVLPETLSWSHSTSSHEVYEFRRSLSHALHAITNLTALTIRANSTSCLSHTYLDLWMLEGCGFRLRKLHNEGGTLYFPGRSHMFYCQQTEVRDWMPGRLDIGHSLELIPGLFSNLSSAHFRDPLMCRFLGPRPLQHVSIDTTRRGITMDEAVELFDILGQSAQTLVELRFITECPSSMPGDRSWWTPIDIIGIIAERLPRLEALNYCETVSTLDRPRCDPDKLIGVLAKFECLETFFIEPLEKMNREDSLPNMELNSGKSCFEIAERFILSCPTLRHITFPAMCRRGWGTHKYAKLPNGRVIFDGQC